jgi:aspartate 1-decarboxylase
MLLTLLSGKIHRATVTEACVDYEGSISIDETLLQGAGVRPFERVEVYNVTTGARFATYAIVAAAGSGMIGVNGAAAHLAKRGDLVIIAAYAQMTAEEADRHQPKLVFVDAANRIRDKRHAERPSTVTV